MNLTPAIQEALTRRQGQGATPGQQMSPAAPAFNPDNQQPATPQTSMPQGASPAVLGASQTPMSGNNGESTLIIKALSERLKRLS